MWQASTEIAPHEALVSLLFCRIARLKPCFRESIQVGPSAFPGSGGRDANQIEPIGAALHTLHQLARRQRTFHERRADSRRLPRHFFSRYGAIPQAQNPLQPNSPHSQGVAYESTPRVPLPALRRRIVARLRFDCASASRGPRCITPKPIRRVLEKSKRSAATGRTP